MAENDEAFRIWKRASSSTVKYVGSFNKKRRFPYEFVLAVEYLSRYKHLVPDLYPELTASEVKLFRTMSERFLDKNGRAKKEGEIRSMRNSLSTSLLMWIFLSRPFFTQIDTIRNGTCRNKQRLPAPHNDFAEIRNEPPTERGTPAIPFSQRNEKLRSGLGADSMEPKDLPTDSATKDVDIFAQDLLIHYPSGFDFKETSRRLVSVRLGRDFSNAAADRLKKSMVERTDGIWVLPSMVINKETMVKMTDRATEWMAREGCFSLDALLDEFRPSIRNIPGGTDFKRFFNAFVAQRIRGKVRGYEGWRICFRENADENMEWKRIANRIHDILAEAGDAVSVEDILAQMPHLDRETVLRAGREILKDTISFTVDEAEYLKLIDHYYLPDDFAKILSAFVERTEVQHAVASIVLLESEFESRYGCGFRTNFGLEDDDVFKEVILKCFEGVEHSWKKDMFVRDEDRSASNVAEIFLRGHSEIFHEDDFFKFALESRGMTNRGMLVLTFLRKHCVRISKERWVSIPSFDKMFSLSEADYIQIGTILKRALGNSVYRSISSLSENDYDSLPKLVYGGISYSWNPYLLTSIATLKVTNARVVNDEPSPYTVTAMIIPKNADFKDAVEYVLQSFPSGYFANAEAAFEYLRNNNIRMTKTAKLLQKLNDYLGAK